MRKMFSGESKVFYLYRYISFAGTSLVYAIEDRGPPLKIKICIILVLFIFAKWITDMYTQSGKASRTIKITVGLEMAGLMILHLQAAVWIVRSFGVFSIPPGWLPATSPLSIAGL